MKIWVFICSRLFLTQQMKLVWTNLAHEVSVLVISVRFGWQFDANHFLICLFWCKYSIKMIQMTWNQCEVKFGCEFNWISPNQKCKEIETIKRKQKARCLKQNAKNEWNKCRSSVWWRTKSTITSSLRKIDKKWCVDCLIASAKANGYEATVINSHHPKTVYLIDKFNDIDSCHNANRPLVHCTWARRQSWPTSTRASQKWVLLVFFLCSISEQTMMEFDITALPSKAATNSLKIVTQQLKFKIAYNKKRLNARAHDANNNHNNSQ